MSIVAALTYPVVLIDVACGFGALLIGIGIGWWIARYVGSGVDDGLDSERALGALAKIRELATSVAHDVGEHTSRVQEISTELNEVVAAGGPLDKVVLDTVTQMVQANEQLQSQLATAEKRLAKQAEEIQTHAADARTDALTQLSNRRAFDAELERRFVEWKRMHTTYSLLMFDIDHFKKFNDSHGHQVGDQVLRGVAKVLRSAMREMDIVCRYGGEEFAIILPATEAVVAQQAAERARSAVEAARFRLEGTDLKVTVSIGMAEIQLGEDNLNLVRRADAALYASKHDGRNVSFYHNGDEAQRITARPAAPGQAPSAVAAPKTAAEHERGDESPTKTLDRLPDQKTFHDELRRRVAESLRTRASLSLMLVHVDNFKSFTTQYGAQVGDLVLDAVAQYLEVLLRDMDLLARHSGGQFSVMLPGSSLENAARVAERVRNAVSSCVIPIRDSKIHLTISLGLAELVADDDVASLVERTEAALSASQSAGPNHAHMHNGAHCLEIPSPEAIAG